MDIKPIDNSISKTLDACSEEELSHMSSNYPFIIKAGKIPDCCLNYNNLLPIWLYHCGTAPLGYVTAQEMIFQCKSCGRHILAKIFFAVNGTCYVTQENSREVLFRNDALKDTLNRMWYIFKIPNSLNQSELIQYHQLAENNRFAFNLGNGKLMTYLEDISACDSNMNTISTTETLQIIEGSIPPVELKGNEPDMLTIDELPPILTPEELVEQGKEVLPKLKCDANLLDTDSIMKYDTVILTTENGVKCIDYPISEETIKNMKDIPMINKYLQKLKTGESLTEEDLVAKKIHDLIIEGGPVAKANFDIKGKEKTLLKDTFCFRIGGDVTKNDNSNVGYKNKIEFYNVYCKSLSLLPNRDEILDQGTIRLKHMYLQDVAINQSNTSETPKQKINLILRNVVYEKIDITSKQTYYEYVDKLIVELDSEKSNDQVCINILLNIEAGEWTINYINMGETVVDEDFKFDEVVEDTDGVHTELSCGKEGYNDLDGECARCRNRECDS